MQLKRWVERPDRKPLVLRGARQVGKTTAVDEFAREFDNYLYVNLENDSVRNLFEVSRPVEELIVDLFAICNRERKPGRTLIFIDEIQNSPRAVAMLRYFYEDAPQIYVVAAGSLLENLIGRNISFPVGRVEYMAMRPCSFREYVVAMGREPLRNRIADNPEASVAFHDVLIGMFNRYALIGGMPEVVSAYSTSGDLASLQRIYSALLQGYRDDSEKYAANRTQTEVIRHILMSGWAEAGKSITLSGFGESSYRSREVGEAFRTLEKAMLLELVYPTTSAMMPMLPDLKRAPKLIWLDTGLVNFAANIQKNVFGAMDIMDAWRGMVAEQVVAQELLTLNLNVDSRRMFWVNGKSGSSAEVDFMLIYNSTPVPIEVKTGHNAKLRSLHSFMDKSDSKVAVRVWSGPYSENNVSTPLGRDFLLLNVPLYLVGFLPAILSRHLGKNPFG